MYVGVVVGALLAGIIIGWDAYDAGALAAFMMILIGVPFWGAPLRASVRVQRSSKSAQSLRWTP
jgi:hypothetical protein